jgi:hypothetical protein
VAAKLAAGLMVIANLIGGYQGADPPPTAPSRHADGEHPQSESISRLRATLRRPIAAVATILSRAAFQADAFQGDAFQTKDEYHVEPLPGEEDREEKAGGKALRVVDEGRVSRARARPSSCVC